ncbi:5-hydroxytryptamine receptor 1D-like [Dreissena polymorpha]|uniref:5-hydroxytryptamine receptor 1D-like n=1 Tax=Dreissena polymorpha TaxID=45954 RepID=UPI0022654251|nr:5-hydroxytryptamine receptor 1D-like [Dreissena polymorpha]
MDNTTLVREKNDSNTVENIPIIVYMAIVCSAGIIGNFVALLFYVLRKDKSAATLVLTALSGNDLICSILLLASTAMLVNSMMYTNVAACKIQGFINHVFIMNSMLLLFILALDRYFSFGNTSKWKSLFARRKTVMCNIVCTTGLSICFSIRELVFFDVVPIDFTVAENVTVKGNRCMITSEKRLAKIANAFNIIDFMLILGIMIAMLTLYSLIIRKVSSVGKRRSARINIGTDESQSAEVSEISLKAVKQSPNENTVVVRNRPSTIRQNTFNFRTTLHWSSTIERRLTQMACILTLASVLTFVPYFVVSIVAEFHKELPIWARIVYRSYALNSTMNPCLIGYYNSEFRAFIKTSITCRFLPSLKRK